MHRRVLSHLRGHAVAYIALFFALSGTAIAAKPLVTGAQIEDDSVTGADVLESSLGQVPTAADADTLDGIDSTEILQQFVTVRNHVVEDFVLADDGEPSVPLVQSCAAGEIAIQGGGGETLNDVRVDLVASDAVLGVGVPTAWEIRLRNNAIGNGDIILDVNVQAVCLKL